MIYFRKIMIERGFYMKKNLLLVCLLLGSFAFAGNDVTVSKKITTSKDRCEGISQETFFNNAEGFINIIIQLFQCNLIIV